MTSERVTGSGACCLEMGRIEPCDAEAFGAQHLFDADRRIRLSTPAQEIEVDFDKDRAQAGRGERLREAVEHLFFKTFNINLDEIGGAAETLADSVASHHRDSDGLSIWVRFAV